ncbi:MAG: hypothetical protein AAGH78_06815 [Cyanobacteria bacterium P01_H01_bin.58]
MQGSCLNSSTVKYSLNGLLHHIEGHFYLGVLAIAEALKQYGVLKMSLGLSIIEQSDKQSLLRDHF